MSDLQKYTLEPTRHIRLHLGVGQVKLGIGVAKQKKQGLHTEDRWLACLGVHRDLSYPPENEIVLVALSIADYGSTFSHAMSLSRCKEVPVHKDSSMPSFLRRSLPASDFRDTSRRHQLMVQANGGLLARLAAAWQQEAGACTNSPKSEPESYLGSMSLPDALLQLSPLELLLLLLPSARSCWGEQ
eukprot:1161897-Pelagomonas_calceolata.AAC.7